MSLLKNVSFWFKTLFFDKSSRSYREMFIYNYYDGYDREIELCKLYNGDDPERYETGLLKIKLSHGKITDEEYDRKLLSFNFNELNEKEFVKENLKLDLKYGKINEEMYEKNLLDLIHDNPDDLKRELLKVDLKYNNITPEMYDREIVQILYKEYPDTKIDEELLRIDFKYNKITKNEYDKKLASLLKKPYVNIISSDYDPTQNINGLAVELDWNQEFIELLKVHGYNGKSDYQIVDKWFDDVCRSVGQNMDKDTDFDFMDQDV